MTEIVLNMLALAGFVGFGVVIGILIGVWVARQ